MRKEPPEGLLTLEQKKARKLDEVKQLHIEIDEEEQRKSALVTACNDRIKALTKRLHELVYSPDDQYEFDFDLETATATGKSGDEDRNSVQASAPEMGNPVMATEQRMDGEQAGPAGANGADRRGRSERNSTKRVRNKTRSGSEVSGKTADAGSVAVPA